ncbi:MAG: hypothetical protein WA883_21690 [Phormidesmis sp.]
MEKKILLAAAIAGALGLVGITWSLSSSPSPRPVAIMHQSRPIVASASNVAAISEAEVPSSQLAQSLKALSKDSDRIQTAAKSNDWQQAQIDLIGLQRSAYQLSQQLPNDNSDIQQINVNIDQLEQAVASKNQQKVQQGTNRLMQLAQPINAKMNDLSNGSPDSQTNEHYSTETISVSK